MREQAMAKELCPLLHQPVLYFTRPCPKKWHHKNSNPNEIIFKSFTDPFMDSFRNPNETSNQGFL
jgi:hypothetical protein